MALFGMGARAVCMGVMGSTLHPRNVVSLLVSARAAEVGVGAVMGPGLARSLNAIQPRVASTRGFAATAAKPTAPSGSAFCELEERGIIELSGPDSEGFLQGLITNDMRKINGTDSGSGAGDALFAGFLNAKGRLFSDVVIHKAAKDVYFLDVARAVIPRILKYLKMTKLRKDVTIFDAREEYDVWALMAPPGASLSALEGEFAKVQAATFVQDPRWAGMGYRLYHGHKDGEKPVVGKLQALGLVEAPQSTYDAVRVWNGIPEGEEVNGVIPLEYNLDQLNGVSFDKGCYVGQELTARTHFQGLVRKRLVPVVIGAAPEEESPDVDAVTSVLLGGNTEGLATLSSPLGDLPAELAPAPDSTKNRSPGKVVAVAESSSLGLAHLRLEPDCEHKWLEPGNAFKTVSGVPVRVLRFPKWWKPLSEPENKN